MSYLSPILIVAVSENACIGASGQLPWRLPADLRFFKQTTLNHAVIMGRKTFESIGKPLPNRLNIVLSRDTTWALQYPDLVVCNNTESALELAASRTPERPPFVIGGANVYKQFLPLAQQLLITEVLTTVEGDAFFEFPKADFVCLERNKYPQDEKNAFDMIFTTWQRK